MNPLSISRAVLVSTHLGLIAFMMLWLTLLSPSTFFPVAMTLIIAITPLLLTLRGVLDGRMRPMAWTIFLSFPYFAHGIGEWVSNPDEALYGAIEVMLSTGLFLGSMLSIRYKARERDKHAAATASEEEKKLGPINPPSKKML